MRCFFFLMFLLFSFISNISYSKVIFSDESVKIKSNEEFIKVSSEPFVRWDSIDVNIKLDLIDLTYNVLKRNNIILGVISDEKKEGILNLLNALASLDKISTLQIGFIVESAIKYKENKLKSLRPKIDIKTDNEFYLYIVNTEMVKELSAILFNLKTLDK